MPEQDWEIDLRGGTPLATTWNHTRWSAADQDRDPQVHDNIAHEGKRRTEWNSKPMV